MQGKKAGCDNVAKYASNLAEYRGPLPPPPLNLQLDQAGNHNEDGPPFRSSIYCLLQAHDIAGCVAQLLCSTLFSFVTWQPPPMKADLKSYYIYLPIYMFSVKVEKFLCLCA